MSDDAAALRDALTRVEKPGRYVGGEWNEVRKDPAGADVKVALAFPDVYEIGMSYLGQKILYALLNADPGLLAERVFAPWPDFEAELRRRHLPLCSLENGLPLGRFDIVGFSLLYELNYSNVLTMLDLGGIPVFSADRDGRHPLIVAGGPAAFNPEPVADIFDLFLLGDGEEAFPDIIRTYRFLRRSGLGREGILGELARLEGVYVPSLYTPFRRPGSPLVAPEPTAGAPPVIRKRVLESFRTSAFPEKIIVPSLRVVFDRVAMEAARGCPQNCRFCQASSVYFPHRARDPELVLRTVLRSLRQTGYEDSSLSALSISDFPYLEETVRCLMDSLGPEKISLSLSSLRPRGLSRNLVADILKVRKTGFTLVPEAGTERLRAVINKKLEDTEIRDALTNAFRGGWQLVKFYFMAGLPTETESDLEAVADMVRDALELGRSILGARPRIHVSLSSFIPKPHTPFQWLAMEEAGSLEDKQRRVRAGLARWKSVEFKDHPVETSVLEAVFSRGDRRLNRVLARAWSNGARFDSWRDRLNPRLWRDAMDEEGVDPGEYLKALPMEAVLPWDHIDPGLKKAHLARELELALAGRPSPACLERTCGECGGCDLRFWKKAAPQPHLESFPAAPPALGKPSDVMARYRAVYAKTGKTRYLSHIDLIHVLQRSFRRAGVAVRKTEGYHPKMDFSYGPALPLGMEGLNEVLDFKARVELDPGEFLARMNRSTPEGIRFSRLERLEPGEPSLAASIRAQLYSLDPGSDEFRRAREASAPAGLRAAMEGYLRQNPGAADVEFREGRLLLRLPPFPLKGRRAQDIVGEAAGIANPVFLLRRDEVVLERRVPPAERPA